MRRPYPILRLRPHSPVFGRVVVLCALASCVVLAASAASAAEGTVTVTAMVGSVSPGETLVVTNAGAVPLYPPSSPGPVPATPLPPSVIVPPGVSSVLTPTVSIEPASGQQVGSRLAKAEDGREREIPVFFTNRPRFSGQTNVPGAEVTFEIDAGDVRLRGKTRTGADGSFSWPAPAFDLPGLYTVQISVTDQSIPALRATETMDFYLDFEAQSKASAPRSRLRSAEDSAVIDPLFDVLVQVTQRYKRILPGEEVVVGVKLLNFGFAGKAVDVPVEYIVEDARGRTITASSETVAVSTQISLLKTFHTAPNAEPGEYTVIVQVPSRGMRALSSDTFEVVSNASLLRGTATDPEATLPWGGTAPVTTNLLLVVFLFFGLFVYSGYNKVSTLILMGRLPPKASEKDLRRYVNQSL